VYRTAVILIITYVLYLFFNLYTNPRGLKVKNKTVIDQLRSGVATETSRLLDRDVERSDTMSSQREEHSLHENEEDEETPVVVWLVCIFAFFWDV
jgi:hypothetical protein